MKRIICAILLLFFAVSTETGTAYAQTADETAAESTQEEAKEETLQAVIRTEDAVEIDRPLIFNASQTINPKDEQLRFEWNFGDGVSARGEEVVHTYKTVGTFHVTLHVVGQTQAATAEMDLFVFEKLFVLLADNPLTKDRIAGLREFSKTERSFLALISSFGSPSEFVAEESFVNKLHEQNNRLEKTKDIIVWTKGKAGLNALSRLRQEEPALDFSNKTIYIVYEGEFRNIGAIERQFFILKSKKIVLLHEAALFPLLTFDPEQSAIERLEKTGHEYRTIDATTSKLRIWNFMSYFVNFLIGQGIPDNTIVLLLLLPVIATVITFTKQVVGITTLGIYTPSIVTLTFLALGLKFGLLALLVILVMGGIARATLRRYRLLFIPKVAIVLTVVALSLFFLLIITTSLHLFDASFLSLAIFPMLILATLIEKFVIAQSEKGFLPTLFLTLETVAVSIVAYFIVGGEIPVGFTTFQLNFIRDLFLNIPELIFVIIIINIMLGRWTGLRLFEYLRFREVIKHAEE